ncbi:hypothetical protein RV01_GL000637 [Enterococcus dispar]|nr:hypothetical protein RV01_GL000637 [Enterococcus dispar]
MAKKTRTNSKTKNRLYPTKNVTKRKFRGDFSILEINTRAARQDS